MTAIVVVITGAAAQRIMQRKATSPPPGRTGPPRTGAEPKNLPSRDELIAVCSGTDVMPEVLDAVVRVAVEIAREGREGQAVGTSFVVGDTGNVLDHSRQFVLNPFQGHPEDERQITDTGTWGHIKEFAQLDGAFIITGKGLIEAAGRYITSDTSHVSLPGGLGSRHSSAAGITQVTRSIGIVVSQSGGLVSIIKEGKIVRTFSS
jgi:DNA integrity scanning protein DisA with diadenylate cyclase activity